jgi:hypothetical protein
VSHLLDCLILHLPAISFIFYTRSYFVAVFASWSPSYRLRATAAYFAIDTLAPYPYTPIQLPASGPGTSSSHAIRAHIAGAEKSSQRCWRREVISTLLAPRDHLIIHRHRRVVVSTYNVSAEELSQHWVRELISFYITTAEWLSQYPSMTPRGDPNAKVTRSGLYSSAPASAIRSESTTSVLVPRYDLNTSLASRDLNAKVPRSGHNLLCAGYITLRKYMRRSTPTSSFERSQSISTRRRITTAVSWEHMGSPIPMSASPSNHHRH